MYEGMITSLWNCCGLCFQLEFSVPSCLTQLILLFPNWTTTREATSSVLPRTWDSQVGKNIFIYCKDYFTKNSFGVDIPLFFSLSGVLMNWTLLVVIGLVIFLQQVEWLKKLIAVHTFQIIFNGISWAYSINSQDFEIY